MVTGDMVQLSFVEGEGICDMMVFVEPEYQLISQWTRYMRKNAVKLRADLQSADEVAITTDSRVKDVSLTLTPTCMSARAFICRHCSRIKPFNPGKLNAILEYGKLLETPIPRIDGVVK